MAHRTVPIVGVAVVLAAGTALWWVTRDGADAIDAEKMATPAAPVAVERTGPTEMPTDDATGVTSAAGEETASMSDGPAVGDGGGDDGGTSVSPFATAEPVGAEKGGDVVEAPTTATAPAEAGVPDVSEASDGSADDGDASTRGRVVVPSSYPITDAAKYYVPREERGSGNLGGPPPLDFPGGPNDPNRADGGIAPPPAPGQ